MFLEESREVLDEAAIQIKACQTDPDDRNAIRELRRAFHTLKGSSRMVGLNSVGEVAWFSESLFNYVLDTEKPLTPEILEFAGTAIDEFESQLADRYASQHLIDVASWGEKTEEVNKLSREDSSLQITVDEAEEVPEVPEVPETVESVELFTDEELSLIHI